MATETRKPILVRAYVYCSSDAAALLREVAKRWLDCMGAHQSNILNEAEALANAANRPEPSVYRKHSIRTHVANETDASRLRRLIGVWGDLTHRQQTEFVGQIKTVVGR